MLLLPTPSLLESTFHKDSPLKCEVQERLAPTPGLWPLRLPSELWGYLFLLGSSWGLT
jgi:hypothetical protein